MKVTAIANSNIALTKYWGKRDEKLMLPLNSSISVTLSELETQTTIEFSQEFEKDVLILNDKEFFEGQKEFDKTIKFLDLVREKANIKEKAKIVSKNNFPTAAGFASSASGFAALALAASKAVGLELDTKNLSMLARRGSGSATRSILGGFNEWIKGEKDSGEDSFLQQIASSEHWPEFRMIACVVSSVEKKIKSTAGMSQTVKTCPLYKGWLDTVEEDVKKMKTAILEKDFKLLGEIAEFNCLKMHATMMTTIPPIIYWLPATLEIIHSVKAWREEEGLECYFTIDGGPQVKVICLEKNVEELNKRLQALSGVQKTIVSKPGPDARLSNIHLF